ncbi:MAG: hypothetical protein OCD01_17585 [Fibrobacterales bacterium]
MKYLPRNTLSRVCFFGILTSLGISAQTPLKANTLIALDNPQTGIEEFEGKIPLGDTFTPVNTVTYETSKSGNHLTEVASGEVESGDGNNSVIITIETDQSNQRQQIEGIGGSMTPASAHVLNQISKEKRDEVIKKYFHPTEGIGYSASRLCIASSDFSPHSYTYSQNESFDLGDFTIEAEMNTVVPLVQDALKEANGNIRIMSSAWTGPPWMKDNNDFKGGKLRHEHRDTYSLFISKYIEEYAKQGIPIWAITPENEPVGNNGSWESMEFTAEEMAAFIDESLGPMMKDKHPEVKMYVFDQNKDEMHHWANTILNKGNNREYVDGIAIHWYSHTENHYGNELEDMNRDFPDHPTFGTEHSIDNIANDVSINDKNFFNNDPWFFEKHVGGWGAAYANPRHPFVAAFYRYARDIIVDLNHWTIGWIDWNFVLDRTGGPNHVNNLCLAPVMIDTDNDDVYYTPLYYAMGHFSKFIRPGSRAVPHTIQGRDGLLATTVLNRDGSLAVVILNDKEDSFDYSIRVNGTVVDGTIDGSALQTVVLLQEIPEEPSSSSVELSSSEEIMSSEPQAESSEEVSSFEESSDVEEESSQQDESSQELEESSEDRTSLMIDLQLTHGSVNKIYIPEATEQLSLYTFLGQLVAQYDVSQSAGKEFSLPQEATQNSQLIIQFK